MSTTGRLPKAGEKQITDSKPLTDVDGTPKAGASIDDAPALQDSSGDGFANVSEVEVMRPLLNKVRATPVVDYGELPPEALAAQLATYKTSRRPVRFTSPEEVDAFVKDMGDFFARNS